MLALGEVSEVATGKERGDDVVSSDTELQPQEEIIPTVRQQTDAFTALLDTGRILGNVSGSVNSRNC